MNHELGQAINVSVVDNSKQVHQADADFSSVSIDLSCRGQGQAEIQDEAGQTFLSEPPQPQQALGQLVSGLKNLRAATRVGSRSSFLDLGARCTIWGFPKIGVH